MQATMRLNIVNKETMKVLNRTLPNNDNYFERVGVKIGLLIKDSLLSNAFALVSLYQLHDEIINLSAYFDDEIDKFEGQIEKKKALNPSKVNFIAQYDYDMPCGNALSCALYELMEGFDRLISTLKLLHLSGLLESRAAFYQLKENYQKKLNALLSQIIQTPSSKNHSITVSELIENPENFNTSQISPHTLKEALNAPYAPGFSPYVSSNLKYKLKSQLSKNNEKCMEA
ncbi:TPA: hypothetical protein ACWM1T_001820 [Legionella pneumophila]|nr:DUF1845 domain-containing protein [Legionella pneumophila]HBD7283608.1 DUF1845 family protein [Legionella pneumophila]HBD9439238.1 DUF1845 family protein [Legionella pneumophila]HEN8241127.1 DUF1845 family protein [Legionella pneumophila]